MFDRFMRYHHRHEPVATAAYFWLTLLEWSDRDQPGVRSVKRKAARKYSVDMAVLNQIGNLSEKERKVTARSRKLKGDERSFLEAATEAIIRRMAERASDPSKALPQITLADVGT